MTQGENITPPLSAARRWGAFALLCAVQFMVVLDTTIVLVALPSIEQALALSADTLQWVVTAYTLIFGGFLLLGGRAADVLGRRRVFLVGLALFALSSLACGLASSGAWLIAARGVQGLGGAIVSPAALAIVTTLFGEGAGRNRALGIWGALGAIGAAAGLLLGGVLTTTLGWASIFFVNVPLGLAVLAAALRLIPADRSVATGQRFDLAGTVTITAGLILLVYAIASTGSAGWLSLRTLLLVAGALALLGGFVAIEARTPAPLVPLRTFRLRQLTSANGVNLLLSAALSAMFFILTLYMQQVLSYSAWQTGLAMLPVSIGIVVVSNVASSLVTRLSPKPVLLVGLVCFAIALGLLVRLPVAGDYWRDLFPTFVVASLGMGCSFVAITVAAFGGVEASDAGLASGLINTTQQIGAALGVAVFATLANARTAALQSARGGATAPEAAQVAGYQAAFFGMAGVIVFALFLAWLLLRGGASTNVAASADSVSAQPRVHP